MSQCGRSLHGEDEWIERVYAHSARQVLYGYVCFAEESSRPPAGGPRCRQVWIEHERSINQHHGCFEVTDDVGESPSGEGERHSIIPPQLCRPLGQPPRLGNLSCTVSRPATYLPPDIAPRCHAICRGEIRVEFDPFVEQPQRFPLGLSSHLINDCYSAQIVIVRNKTFCRLALGAPDFSLF